MEIISLWTVQEHSTAINLKQETSFNALAHSDECGQYCTILSCPVITVTSGIRGLVQCSYWTGTTILPTTIFLQAVPWNKESLLIKE